MFGMFMLFVFSIFPPALLIVRFVARKPAWWVILISLLLFVVVGWLFIVGAFVFDQLHISELIQQGRGDELPEGWDADGARGVFAVFLGWLLPLVYCLVWLVLYAVAALVRMPLQAKKEGR